MRQDEHEELVKIVAEAVAQAMQDKHICRLALDETTTKEVGHIFGMLKDLGKDSLRAGVEEVRSNHIWISDLRTKSAKTVSAVWICLVLTSAGGILSALWLGIKQLLAMAKS